MADVQFDEEESLVGQNRMLGNLGDGRSGLVKLIMSLRLAKTEAQANYVLIAIMVLSFLTTFIVISKYLL
jgi:hypothetical protein